MKSLWFFSAMSLYVTLMLLTGCASTMMGPVQRFEAGGQQILCWEPSRNLNGVAGFIANRFEGSPGLDVSQHYQKNLTEEDKHVLEIGPGVIQAAKQVVAAYKRIPKNITVTPQVQYAANVLQQALDGEIHKNTMVKEKDTSFSVQYTRR